MTNPVKSLLLAAACLAATALAANAQAPYAAKPYAAPYGYAPPVSPARAYPPSWSYDPYTSGRGPCPQKLPGDLTTCQQNMPPTYGQPSYWPNR
jgi:hypothetical protein